MPKDNFDSTDGGDDEGWDVVGKKNKKKKGIKLHLSEFNENAQMPARSVRPDEGPKPYGQRHSSHTYQHQQQHTAPPARHHQASSSGGSGYTNGGEATASGDILEEICEVPQDEISDIFRSLKRDAAGAVRVNHLLVENVDMMSLVAKGVKVDIMFRERFGAYGEIIHFRIFTDHEAIAISLDTGAHAAEALHAQHWTVVEGRRLHVSPVKAFPNDKWLRTQLDNFKSYAEFCKQYKTSGRLTYNRATNMFYRPGYYETVHNQTRVQRPLEPVPEAPRAPRPPGPAAPVPPAIQAPAAARPAPALQPPVAAKAILQLAPHPAMPAAAPAVVDEFASSQLAQGYDSVQIVGCTTAVLTDHYYKCDKFTIPSQHFREPERVLHAERTVLALHNFDDERLVGLWRAVGNGGGSIEWEQLALSSLPRELFGPLLQPFVALPIGWDALPIKLPGVHAKRLLLAFEHQVGAARLAAAGAPAAAAAPGGWPASAAYLPSGLPPGPPGQSPSAHPAAGVFGPPAAAPPAAYPPHYLPAAATGTYQLPAGAAAGHANGSTPGAGAAAAAAGAGTGLAATAADGATAKLAGAQANGGGSAPGDPKRKRLCFNDCNNPAAYINLVCKHLGPCTECCPKPEDWAAKFGQCAQCGEKNIRPHRIIF